MSREIRHFVALACAESVPGIHVVVNYKRISLFSSVKGAGNLE